MLRVSGKVLSYPQQIIDREIHLYKALWEPVEEMLLAYVFSLSIKTDLLIRLILLQSQSFNTPSRNMHILLTLLICWEFSFNKGIRFAQIIR